MERIEAERSIEEKGMVGGRAGEEHFKMSRQGRILANRSM